MIAEIFQSVSSNPSNVIMVPGTMLILLIVFGVISFLLFFFLFLGLVTNRESWFWYWIRFRNQIAVAEFDDSGKVEFVNEKSLGQGVTKKASGDKDYSVTPRNVSIDISGFIEEETNRRMRLQLEGIEEPETEEERTKLEERIDLAYKVIKAKVEEEFKGVTEALEVATDINRFRAFTRGTRTPFFIRYSGKAVLVNPLTGVVISGGKYARVLDLKTFMGKMITPSQIKYIATLSEMIGAKQLKKDGGIPVWIIIIAVVILVTMIVVWGLPAMGVKVF
jgi:hypothetical protein